MSAVAFSDLPGWAEDRHAAAIPALQRSCTALERKPEDARIGVSDRRRTGRQWRAVCAALRSLPAGDDGAARSFFETWFEPYQVAGRDGVDGLFTGYYEPVLHGARQRDEKHRIPLYLRPPDLVTVNLGQFKRKLRGQRIVGRVVDGRLVPFATRREIDRGAIADQGLELVWVDDPVDAFFLHIQGSGSVVMDDGSVMRVGYDTTNGHRYTAIGGELIRRGEIAREDMSMQAIRAWLAVNPDAARDLMAKNASYIFFRQRDGTGPYGAQDVQLTAGRSLAVDRRFIALGHPVWVDTEDPVDDDTKLRRLMIAQDTGGAIRGAVRGDVFWGSGPEAAERAGRMRHTGRYYVLIPRPDADQPTS